MKFTLPVATCLGVFLSIDPVFAINQDAKEHLRLFKENPKQAMFKTLPKRNADGQVVHASSYFTQNEISATGSETFGDFVSIKDRERSQFCSDSIFGHEGAQICLNMPETEKSAMEDQDNPRNLVKKLRYLDLESMEQQGLKDVRVDHETQPWSGDYFAIYNGIAGVRYLDSENFPMKTTNWEEKWHYVKANPVSAIVESGDQSQIDKLSPSEKYDLLIGEYGTPLTDAQWKEGAQIFYSPDSRDKPEQERVERWNGICHGWAPASYKLPRPVNTVETLAADGETMIRFFPSDLKALGSLLWANARQKSRFIGSRCDAKDPQTDDNGRIIVQECFDSNPATWHLTVVNQLNGGKGEPFVMDAIYDYEVWNHPVVGYRYNYFNPITMETVDNLEDATVEYSEYEATDPFASYRAKRVPHKVVGITMEVEYVIETPADGRKSDSYEYDLTNSVTYVYDLELDESNRIYGGEWYTVRHPDFLWTPAVDEIILNGEEQLVDPWDVAEEMPRVWQEYGNFAALYNLPLGRAVQELFEKSAQNVVVNVRQ